jgi:hypothetical protein
VKKKNCLNNLSLHKIKLCTWYTSNAATYIDTCIYTYLRPTTYTYCVRMHNCIHKSRIYLLCLYMRTSGLCIYWIMSVYIYMLFMSGCWRERVVLMDVYQSVKLSIHFNLVPRLSTSITLPFPSPKCLVLNTNVTCVDGLFPNISRHLQYRKFS